MDRAELTRTQILDAAESCLLEGGFAESRLHTAIAKRAGLSRPTVYKYVGDLQAIRSELVNREMTTFFDELRQRLDQVSPLREYVLDILAWTVDYARAHRLLQAALRDVPDQVLPIFTTHAKSIMHLVAEFAEPHIQHLVDSGELPATAHTRPVVDLVARLLISLVVTDGLVDIDTPEGLRTYLEEVIDLGGHVARSGQPTIPRG